MVDLSHITQTDEVQHLLLSPCVAGRVCTALKYNDIAFNCWNVWDAIRADHLPLTMVNEIPDDLPNWRGSNRDTIDPNPCNKYDIRALFTTLDPKELDDMVQAICDDDETFDIMMGWDRERANMYLD